MGFKAVLLATVVVSGGLGGAWAHFAVTGQVVPARQITARATSAVRSTFRSLENSDRYQRGEAYSICSKAFEDGVGSRSNAEITLGCECLDKRVGGLSWPDRSFLFMTMDQNGGVVDVLANGKLADGTTVPHSVRDVLRTCDLTLKPGEDLRRRGVPLAGEELLLH